MKVRIPRMIRTFLATLFVLTVFGVQAQDITIKGIVTSSDDNSAVPGVSVFLKGTTTGTVTDLNGTYELNVNAGDIISFSFIGFITYDLSVISSVSTYNVTLKPDRVNIDEIVVIGYGTQKKDDLTGAVSIVNNEELNQKPVATFEQAMQGLAAGVTVTSNSGAPGEGAIIRIRGVGSIGSTTPLYVIDGVPAGGPNSTNPADIESVTVLKDAAACAIYGARGANGVILITTKKGTRGRFKVDFEAQIGIQQAAKKLDLLHSEDYARLANEVNFNRGRTGPVETRDPFNQEFDTDWQDAMFRNAFMQQYNLSVSGGNKYTSYSVSGGYLGQEGIMISSGFQRWNFRVNTEYKRGIFRVGESFVFNHSNRNNEKNGVGGRSQIERILKITPNLPIYDTSQLGGYAGPDADYGHDAVNPVGVANLYTDKDITNGILGNVFGEVEIIKGLKYKLNFGVDYYKRDEIFGEPAYEMGSYQRVGDPRWDTTNITSTYFLWENTLTWDRYFNKHHVTLLGGYSQERSEYKNKYVQWKLYQPDSLSLDIDDPEKIYESGLVSYFGRASYDYAGKYLFQFNIRRDGSSKFSEANRWGLFPSLSIGWVMSKEKFMQNQNAISYLKFRGSYGALGNQAIDDYQYEASLNLYQNYYFAGGIANGTGPRMYANPNVKWETTIQGDFGIDLNFLQDRLSFVFDYYNYLTKDMLIPITMPISNGSETFADQNAGSVKNEGLEFTLSWRKYEGKFHYSISGNLTTIRNEVVDLGPGDQPIYGGESELGNATKTALGQPIGSFFGYVTDGIYKTQDEIDPDFAPNAKPGDIRFKDLDGDGLLTEDDRDFIGSPIPTMQAALNFAFDIKGFDFQMTVFGVYGNKIFRETKMWTDGMFSNFNASTDVNNRFRAEGVTITTKPPGGEPIDVYYPANLNTEMPWAVRSDPNKNALQFSDRYIEDGSFVRLQVLTVGYTLPRDKSEKIKAERLRFYITALNLFTFTNYSGYDPEIGSYALNTGGTANTSRGIDNGYYPQARSFVFGVQFTF